MVFSVVAHAAILGYAVIGFSSAKPYDPYQEALPVEVLTLATPPPTPAKPSTEAISKFRRKSIPSTT